jgi:hypothetical protein
MARRVIFQWENWQPVDSTTRLVLDGGLFGGQIDGDQITYPNVTVPATVPASARAGDIISLDPALPGVIPFTNQPVTHSVVEIIDTRTFRVDPPPVEGAAYNSEWHNRNTDKVGQSSFGTSTSSIGTGAKIINFIAPNIIRCKNEDVGFYGFVTNDVQRNDRVVVRETFYPLNMRSYFVDEVVNEHELKVRPLNSSPAIRTESNPGGEVIVRQGGHFLYFEDEFYPSWTLGATAKVSNKFGSGFYEDFITLKTLPRGQKEILTEGLHVANVNLTGTRPCEWISEGEGVSNLNLARGPSDYDQGTADPVALPRGVIRIGGEEGTAVLAVGSELRLGKAGADNVGASKGSQWFGWWPARLHTTANPIQFSSLRQKVYGSLVDIGDEILVTFNNADYRGAMLRARVVQFSGPLGASGGSFNAVTYNPPFGLTLEEGSRGVPALAVGGSGGIFQNLVSQYQDLDSLIVLAAPAGEEAVIGGLLLSDSVDPPSGAAFSHSTTAGDVIIFDPQEDYDLSRLFESPPIPTAPPDSKDIKRYTWNPRFVEADTLSSATPKVISNLYVEVKKVLGTSQTKVFGGITNSDGKINSGLGITVDVDQILNEGASEFTRSNFTHRVTVQGAGFQIIDQLIDVTSKTITDFPVYRARPDYEGEFNE